MIGIGIVLRRMAVAVGLLFAVLGSQLPEFAEQYRQRLGGAVDELSSEIAQFDAEASAQSLTRAEGIARLESNDDVLARQRGASISGLVKRKDTLELDRIAFDDSGPLGQYLLLAGRLDRGIARQAMTDYQPAIPTTQAGFVAAAVGLGIGWMLTHLVALPLRRRRARRTAAA